MLRTSKVQACDYRDINVSIYMITHERPSSADSPRWFPPITQVEPPLQEWAREDGEHLLDGAAGAGWQEAGAGAMRIIGCEPFHIRVVDPCLGVCDHS
jgi:hypothetical protein